MGTSFERRLGLDTAHIKKAAPPPVGLCRPNDDQLRETLKAARDAMKEGTTLRFQPWDIAALVEELLEFRMKRVLLEKPE